MIRGGSEVTMQTLEQQAAGHEILYREGFLDSAGCDLLARCFERCVGLTFKNPMGDPFWDDRYLWITSLPDTEAAARSLMQATRFRALAALREFYGEPELYSDTIQLVKWKTGMSMPPHADNAHPDGSPHDTPWRDYASVVYLNDDYEGGDLYLPRIPFRLATRKGLLLGFRGDYRHEHGVDEIKRGVRYTMPGWYSRDRAHEDPSVHAKW